MIYPHRLKSTRPRDSPGRSYSTFVNLDDSIRDAPTRQDCLLTIVVIVAFQIVHAPLSCLLIWACLLLFDYSYSPAAVILPD